MFEIWTYMQMFSEYDRTFTYNILFIFINKLII